MNPHNFANFSLIVFMLLSYFLWADKLFAEFKSLDQIILAQEEGGVSPTRVEKNHAEKKRTNTSKKSALQNSGSGSGSSTGSGSTDINDGYKASSPNSTKRSAPVSSRAPRGLALGLSLGWEAIYGNGVVVHFLPTTLFDVHGGLGYTLSGVRLGAGAGINIFFGRSFALNFGTAISHTTGSKGEVSLTAKFSPEGGASSEDVVASKDYEISSSQALSPYAGILIELMRGFYLSGLANYNAVVSGNTVSLGSEIRYDKDIQTTNQDSFESEFNSKAKERAAAGGIGFTLGGLMFL